MEKVSQLWTAAFCLITRRLRASYALVTELFHFSSVRSVGHLVSSIKIEGKNT